MGGVWKCRQLEDIGWEGDLREIRQFYGLLPIIQREILLQLFQFTVKVAAKQVTYGIQIRSVRREHLLVTN